MTCQCYVLLNAIFELELCGVLVFVDITHGVDCLNGGNRLAPESCATEQLKLTDWHNGHF